VLNPGKINDSEPMVLPLVRIEDGQTIKPATATALMDDTINSVVLAADPQSTEPGSLTRGPHIYLPSGEYEAMVRLQPMRLISSQPLLKIEILTVHNANAKLAAERNITSDHLESPLRYQDIHLPFSLSTPGYAEFVFCYPQKTGLKIMEVTVSSIEKEIPSVFLEAESLSGFMGSTQADSTASGGKAILVSPHGYDRDFVVFGPDTHFSPGTYRTDFNIKSFQNGDNTPAKSSAVAELTIVTEKGRHVLAARKVNTDDLDNAKYTPVPLVWRLDHPARISFRVKPAAGYQFWLDDIHTQSSAPAEIIQDIPSPHSTLTASPYYAYPASQMPHTTGRVIIDPVTGHKVIEARQGDSGPGYLTFGPYTQLPAGQYQARFHLQAGSAGKQIPLLNLEVANLNHQKVEILSQMTLFGGSFNGSNAYKVFSIPFDSTFTEKLEFRTEYLGIGDIRVSKVEIFLHEQRIETETVSSETGAVHADPLASGGKALVLQGARTQTSQGAGWRHALSLEPGSYQLTWRLKPELRNTHDSNSADSLATLQISGPSKTLLVQQELTAAHFETPNYYRIPMRFSLSERSDVIFSLQHQGPSPIWLDSLVLNAVAATPKNLN
ncbi:MAG: hypothetical protein WBG37_00770, partial [Desulfobacterales bacterium]